MIDKYNQYPEDMGLVYKSYSNGITYVTNADTDNSNNTNSLKLNNFMERATPVIESILRENEDMHSQS